MKKIFFSLILAYLILEPCGFVAAQDRPLRIISLTPATTEILFALGLKNEIIGVSSFCDFPKEALSKEKVGSFSQANIEKILSLKPDIVFCTGLEQNPIVTELRQLKLKVYVCDPSDLKELFSCILEIGRMTQKEKEALALIQTMNASIKEIALSVAAIPVSKRPKVFVEIWHDPLMSSGQGSFVDELITLAGGINIAHDMRKPYSYYSPEQVLEHNPDIIILAYMTKDTPLSLLQARLGWKMVAAVKNGRVYNDIDPNILLRPGPRLTEGLKELHKRLYP